MTTVNVYGDIYHTLLDKFNCFNGTKQAQDISLKEFARQIVSIPLANLGN